MTFPWEEELIEALKHLRKLNRIFAPGPTLDGVEALEIDW